jgi:hypothetical protein
MVRGFLEFLFEEQFHLQYLFTKKKKTSKLDLFSSSYGSSKLDKKNFQHPRGRWTPVRHSVCQGKMERALCNSFFAKQS